MTAPGKKSRKSVGSKKRRKTDYKVGYKKPPVESRFKPGQSGNPAGRAKSNVPHMTRKALLQIVQDEAQRPLPSANGDVPAVRAVVRSMIIHGIKNSATSQKLFLSLLDRADKAYPQPEENFDWSKLSDDEVDEFARLCCKASGEEES
jgi:hypothetical protein